MANEERRSGDVGAALADARVRATPQRLLVLTALAAESDDATAQTIYRRLRDAGHAIGLSTVYRALALLSERGVVDELAHRPGEACYRLCSPGHHHHLVCSSCHRVDELEGCDLDDWLGRASRRRGFSPTSHTLEVVGLCADCQAA